MGTTVFFFVTPPTACPPFKGRRFTSPKTGEELRQLSTSCKRDVSTPCKRRTQATDASNKRKRRTQAEVTNTPPLFQGRGPPPRIRMGEWQRGEKEKERRYGHFSPLPLKGAPLRQGRSCRYYCLHGWWQWLMAPNLRPLTLDLRPQTFDLIPFSIS